jgi:hypothetical protein
MMSIIDVVQKEKKLNHATFVIKKTGKLNFIKVFDTLQVDVTKNSAPDKNSRARRKDGPKLLRKPGKFQNVLGGEIHGSLADISGVHRISSSFEPDDT